MARSTLPELRQPVKEAPVIAAMKRLSSQYSRYAYRRIRIFLRREALAMSASRAERLRRKAGLQLPRRRPRRRIAVSRPRPLPPRAANHV
jgi:putative transposase